MKTLATSIGTGALLLAAFAMAQEPQTTDLTGQDVTVDKLVGALQIPTRGIEAKCSPYQEEMKRMTRGIGVAANSVATAQEVPDEIPAIEPVKTASVTATFEINSADLTPETEQLLDTVATALNTQALATQCFQLAGHTCDLGENGYNLELSRERADAVKTYLVSHGVAAERIRSLPRRAGRQPVGRDLPGLRRLLADVRRRPQSRRPGRACS